MTNMKRLTLITMLVTTSLFLTPIAFGKPPGACSSTADTLEKSCRSEVAADYQKSIAVCTNSANNRDCILAARATRDETLEECDAVSDAREDVCGALGEAKYQPRFGPEFATEFVNPRDIGTRVAPNPFHSLVVGARHVYEKAFVDEEGQAQIERVVVTVTNRTKLIDGINCRVVRDVVSVDDKVVEDTEDWFAQDVYGNVWYCGELSQDFEEFEGDRPELVELVSLHGSFKAGRDGAKAGIIMLAQPQVGMTYREEASWNEAEDLSEVLSLTASESVPAARCSGNCLKLRAFTPVEPGKNEFKYYVPGIGEILSVNERTGSRAQLVEFTIP